MYAHEKVMDELILLKITEFLFVWVLYVYTYNVSHTNTYTHTSTRAYTTDNVPVDI